MKNVYPKYWQPIRHNNVYLKQLNERLFLKYDLRNNALMISKADLSIVGIEDFREISKQQFDKAVISINELIKD